jgi:hypothetical protein
MMDGCLVGEQGEQEEQGEQGEVLERSLAMPRGWLANPSIQSSSHVPSLRGEADIAFFIAFAGQPMLRKCVSFEYTDTTPC